MSLGWQPCTCCSLLICARFYKAGLWLQRALYRDCNYCCLAEMPSITNKLCCIQMRESHFLFWILRYGPRVLLLFLQFMYSFLFSFIYLFFSNLTFYRQHMRYYILSKAPKTNQAPCAEKNNLAPGFNYTL